MQDDLDSPTAQEPRDDYEMIALMTRTAASFIDEDDHGPTVEGLKNIKRDCEACSETMDANNAYDDFEQMHALAEAARRCLTMPGNHADLARRLLIILDRRATDLSETIHQ
jgi:hypothetical protein